MLHVIQEHVQNWYMAYVTWMREIGMPHSIVTYRPISNIACCPYEQRISHIEQNLLTERGLKIEQA